MSIRFKLNFVAPGPQDPPFSPTWNIGLGNHPIDKGTPLITPLSNTQADIDNVIDSLIGELETIRNQVKKKYQKH